MIGCKHNFGRSGLVCDECLVNRTVNRTVAAAARVARSTFDHLEDVEVEPATLRDVANYIADRIEAQTHPHKRIAEDFFDPRDDYEAGAVKLFREFNGYLNCHQAVRYPIDTSVVILRPFLIAHRAEVES